MMMDRKHILIAEDEKHIRLALGIVLKQAGFAVDVAANGHEAFETVMRHASDGSPINLIITDIFMPKVDGLELMDMLNEKGFTIPVIVITGYGNSELIVKLRTRGFAGYLDKPFIPDELLTQVKTVLQEYAAA